MHEIFLPKYIRRRSFQLELLKHIIILMTVTVPYTRPFVVVGPVFSVALSFYLQLFPLSLVLSIPPPLSLSYNLRTLPSIMVKLVVVVVFMGVWLSWCNVLWLVYSARGYAHSGGNRPGSPIRSRCYCLAWRWCYTV